MSRNIVMVIVYIFEMLTSFCFFSRIYKKKQKSYLTVIFIGLLLFLPSSYIFSVFENEIINVTVFFIINLVYALICFDTSLKNAAIQSAILDALMVSTELLSIFLLSTIFNFPTSQYKSDTHLLIILASICKLAYFTLSQLLSFITIKIGNKNSKIKQFLPLFIFPILTIASCTVFLFTSLKNEMSNSYKIAISVICILYIFACVFIFIYYQTLANREAKINELEAEKRLYNLNNTYLEILQHQNDELQMIFHDTKNHYTALSNFDSIEDVKAYISRIYPELEEKNIIKISNNKMLDLIISKYIVVCKNNNIKFNYEVKTANLDYLDDSELSIILNNVLDNAVEAAKSSIEKQIEFSLRHINNMDLLSVVNSCDNPPLHNNKQLLTTKFDVNSHGFGTKIIEKHTKKNNGKYEWFYDDKEHRFHLTILFQR
jgi:two-component sensor histidine kinase